MWSEEIGQRLDDLSRTMTRQTEVEKVCICSIRVSVISQIGLSSANAPQFFSL